MLDRLRSRLGAGAFDVVDHWDADLCAVGIARPDNHSVLVYISTFGRSDGGYFVSLEFPPQPDDEQWANHPYTPAGEQRVSSFDELVQVIQRHFGYDRSA
ncbi:MAG: hypothetical protein JSS02_24950 [Planctomycetes bacterium]|nr:hypothetical protein [Planctomycetota bacterium]